MGFNFISLYLRNPVSDQGPHINTVFMCRSCTGCEEKWSVAQRCRQPSSNSVRILTVLTMLIRLIAIYFFLPAQWPCPLRILLWWCSWSHRRCQVGGRRAPRTGVLVTSYNGSAWERPCFVQLYLCSLYHENFRDKITSTDASKHLVDELLWVTIRAYSDVESSHFNSFTMGL